jgi:hypothetical protein
MMPQQEGVGKELEESKEYISKIRHLQ